MNRSLITPKVKDILIKKIITLKASSSIIDAIDSFNKHNISSALVINNQSKIIGHISESDLIKALSNSLFYDELNSLTVKNMMVTTIISAKENWDIFELEKFLIHHHLHSVPVIDNNDHVIGMVSRKDVLKKVQQIIEAREEYKNQIKTSHELSLPDKVNIVIHRSRLEFEQKQYA